MSLSRIKLDEIDFSERPFVFSLPKRDKLLLESIRRYGIIEPPVVLENREGLFPICGEGRLLSAKTLGMTTIEVLILRELAPLEALHLSLESNLFRGLNLAEKAEVVSRFERYLPPEEVSRKIFPRLGIPENPRWYFFLKRLSESPEEIKLAVAKETLNPKVAETLTKFPSERQLFFLALFQRFRFTFSEQREVLIGLLDLSKRYDLEIEEVVAREFSEMADRKGFLKKLRRLLKPQVHRFEEDLLRTQKVLLKKGIHFEATQAYEKDRFKISFDFKTREELIQKIRALEDFSETYPSFEAQRPE